MKAHPLAELFPMLDDAGLHELAFDIKTHGQVEPIVVLDGLILDGRNRAEACRRAGIEPKWVAYNGDDPVAFVASKNLHRRQLTTSQRAIVAAEIIRLMQAGGAPVRQMADADTGIYRSSAERAGSMLGIGDRTVERGRVVLEHGVPELVAAVKAGEMRVSKAAELATHSPAEQRAALAEPPAPRRAPAPAPPASAAPPPPVDLAAERARRDASMALALAAERAVEEAVRAVKACLADPSVAAAAWNALDEHLPTLIRLARRTS